MDWRDVSIMVSYQIKKREKKGATRKKKETLTIFVYTWNYVFILSLSFLIDMQG